MSRFTSVFSQLLQLFSRVDFQRAVKETRAERNARGFTCWGQFVAMLFCQLGRAPIESPFRHHPGQTESGVGSGHRLSVTKDRDPTFVAAPRVRGHAAGKNASRDLPDM